MELIIFRYFEKKYLRILKPSLNALTFFLSANLFLSIHGKVEYFSLNNFALNGISIQPEEVLIETLTDGDTNLSGTDIDSGWISSEASVESEWNLTETRVQFHCIWYESWMEFAWGLCQISVRIVRNSSEK